MEFVVSSMSSVNSGASAAALINCIIEVISNDSPCGIVIGRTPVRAVNCVL